jgi:hypothetical protein
MSESQGNVAIIGAARDREEKIRAKSRYGAWKETGQRKGNENTNCKGEADRETWQGVNAQRNEKRSKTKRTWKGDGSSDFSVPGFANAAEDDEPREW